jgi:hypothetical protein
LLKAKSADRGDRLLFIQCRYDDREQRGWPQGLLAGV